MTSRYYTNVDYRLLSLMIASFVAIIGVAVFPQQALATCILQCDARLAYSDCSYPVNPTVWPRDEPLYIAGSCDECCSVPGGPSVCSPTDPEPFINLSRVEGNVNLGGFQSTGASCDGDSQLVFNGPLLEEGDHWLLGWFNLILLQFDATLPPPRVSGFWPAQGPPNTMVFVFGDNFEIPSSVEVNQIPAPLAQTVDDTLLLFVLPEGDTTGLITVTTSTGTSTSGESFGQPVSGLNINGIWPDKGPTSTIVFVFGSNFVPGATFVDVSGVQAQLVQIFDENLLAFLMPVAATTGPVSVTTTEGTVSSTTVFVVTP